MAANYPSSQNSLPAFARFNLNHCVNHCLKASLAELPKVANLSTRPTQGDDLRSRWWGIHITKYTLVQGAVGPHNYSHTLAREAN